jgi:hypothetical protein
LKYTGNLTSDLTLTTVFGQLKSPHTNTYDGYDVYNPATAILQVASTPATRAPGLNYVSNQPITGNILPKDSEDKVKSFRLDLEYKLGAHTIRVGGDRNKLESVAGFFRAGGSSWTFQRQLNPTVAAPLVGSGPTAIDAGRLLRSRRHETLAGRQSNRQCVENARTRLHLHQPGRRQHLPGRFFRCRPGTGAQDVHPSDVHQGNVRPA